MAHYFSSMEGFDLTVNCMLCGTTSGELKFLECLHAVCRVCAEHSQENTIVCKECAEVTTIGENTTLPHHFLQEAMNRTSQLTNRKVCFPCQKKGASTVGTHVCLQCDNAHLCVDCVKIHGQKSATKWHQAPVAIAELYSQKYEMPFRTLHEISNLCSVHRGRKSSSPLVYYCTTCEKPACQACLKAFHNKGEHAIVDMDVHLQGLDANMEEIQKEATIKKEVWCEVLGEVETQIDRRKSEKKQLCAELDSRFNAIIKEIRRLHKEYTAHLNRFYSHQAAEGYTQLQRVQDKMKYTDNVIKMKDIFHRVCTNTEICHHHKFISEHLEKVSKERVFQETVTVDNVPVLEEPVHKVTGTLATDLLGALVVKGFDMESSVESQNDGSILGTSKLEDLKDWNLSTQDVTLDVQHEIHIDEFKSIRDLDLTQLGEILVTGDVARNKEPRILVYSCDGLQKGSLKHPIKVSRQIRADRDMIYIADSKDCCVKVIDWEGAVQQVIVASGLLSPNIGVTVNEQRVYISGPNQIYSCSKGQNKANTWCRIDLGGHQYLSLTPTGDVVVSGYLSDSIYVFSSTGKVLFSYGTRGCGDGQLRGPRGVTVDRQGYIYVADSINNRVSKISPTGEFMGHILTQEKHGISHPRYVKVNRQGDVFVVAHSDNKIAVFKVNTGMSFCNSDQRLE